MIGSMQTIDRRLSAVSGPSLSKPGWRRLSRATRRSTRCVCNQWARTDPPNSTSTGCWARLRRRPSGGVPPLSPCLPGPGWCGRVVLAPPHGRGATAGDVVAAAAGNGKPRGARTTGAIRSRSRRPRGTTCRNGSRTGCGVAWCRPTLAHSVTAARGPIARDRARWCRGAFVYDDRRQPGNRVVAPDGAGAGRSR